MIEQYRGEGELGRLLVLVINNERLSFDALAIGNGVHFKGAQSKQNWSKGNTSIGPPRGFSSPLEAFQIEI